ncbi:MAG: DUF4132 domain-containing protein [Clostridia bacterium]|nr:DUF4132 domain-containing protein [Clostridia bacterium]
MHEETVKKQELASRYMRERRTYLKQLQDFLPLDRRSFFFVTADNYDVKIYSAMTDAMKKPETVPSEYITKYMSWLFDAAVPFRCRDVILYFADRLQEYPYSDSWGRRSFRASDNGSYGAKLMHLIRAHAFPHVDAEPIDVLNRNLPADAQAFLDENPWHNAYSEWQIAYALDHRDGAVEEAVTRILTEENGMGRVTRELIRGVLFSQRSDFHALVGKLLVAARLQEGLRQCICENADCGTRRGFLAILRVIDENNLIRFSSVKRAVGTWLGLISEETRDLERVSAKSVRLIIECLESEEARRAHLASEDAMQIHIALWSYGFDDIHRAVWEIERISENGSRHQLLVAGYFAANMELSGVTHRIAATVLKRHADKTDVLAVWLPSFLKNADSTLWDAWSHKLPVDYSEWFRSAAELNESYLLIKRIYDAFDGKSKTFSPCVFPWHEATLEKSKLAGYLCRMAALSGETEKIDEACGFIKDCSSRHFAYTCLLKLHEPKTAVQRRTALEGLADREQYSRNTAYGIVSEMKLSAEEYRFLEAHQRFKGEDIRKFVLTLLMKQDDADLAACITRLLADKKEDVRLGGLDLIAQLKKDEKRSALADTFRGALTERIKADKLPSKEKILLEALLPEEKKETEEAEKSLFSPEDKYLPADFDEEYIALCLKTFEEYFPASELPAAVRGKKRAGLFGKLLSPAAKACPSSITAALDLLTLSKLIEEHKNDAFEHRAGYQMLLGNVGFAHLLVDKDGKFPLMHLWREWIEKRGITNQRLVCALLLFHAYPHKTKFSEACAGMIRSVYGVGFEWGKPLPYSPVMSGVLHHLLASVPKEELTCLAAALTAWFIRCVPDDEVMISSPAEHRYSFSVNCDFAHLLAHKQLYLLYHCLECKNDGALKQIFPLAAASAERCAEAYRRLPKPEAPKNMSAYYLRDRDNARCLRSPKEDYDPDYPLVGVKEYLLAAYRGIITESQLYEFLLRPDNIRSTLETVTAVASRYFEKGRQISSHNAYGNVRGDRVLRDFLGKEKADETDTALIRFVSRVYESIIPTVLSSEFRRGDSPARYSAGIPCISRIYGADNLARILESLGNDTIDRMSYDMWEQPGRKGSLSHLLAVCIPAEGDSEETLRAALAGRQITQKRLIEAALFSPEWIPIIGKYLGIEGFESVCYYFMAHMNEQFDDKRKAMIARFTPLSEDELNLGAFDVNWFRSAYASIGEKEFDLIYDAAKYISDGAKHSRARKYADAALGRFEIGETEKTISDKRNKDLLMAYALIPISGEDDICRRYLYLQRFRKESKQFGSQRIASEAKAVEMALTNLAINAGYSDTMRLTLRMETKVIDDSRALLEPQTVEDVTLKIALDENGKATLTASKGGKALKSVPAKIKKHETTVTLTALVKTLTEQYRRTRVMLEQAMEDKTEFTFAELSALSAHPVVYPMLKNLVLVSESTVGFLAEGGLRDSNGALVRMEDGASLRIAHPFDLYERGCWREYQQYLYAGKIKQPFRQVFRELYIKTEEEKNLFHSLRYAGNQIQPAKTLGALKSRRWVADIEDGLQKVYYKENIVAQIYALADLFSPADIEAPTLEWVCFTDRKTGEDIKIADIPDVLFSEVMRDVDLAVSVAHAGGVDPETSHSTMEMRAAILSFVLPMFRLGNVRVEGHHALIEGKLAEYSVHLGSGTVHQIGGAMIPVLPVHSQHRGKIFLPFVDDDPKTAEIISKVLLFAEDTKIKDPLILDCITR